MNLKLFCVQPEKVDLVWPLAKGYLDRAFKRGGSDATLMHHYMQLKTHQSLLWIISDTDVPELLAAGITEIALPVGGTTRICLIHALGGRRIKLWRKFWKDIEQYARSMKCQKIRICGRRGWERILRDDGYKQPWIALEKELI